MAILTETHPQPASGRSSLLARLKAWRRERRLARERVALFTGAQLLVVSHTKSGRTWLRVMLSHVFHQQHGIASDLLIGGANFQRLAPEVPRVFFTRDTVWPAESGQQATARVAPGQRVLFLVRDPRDVAVSFYFHVLKRASPHELARKGIPPEARDLPLERFLEDERLGVPRVIGFLNRWAEELPGMPHAMCLRYEDLRAEPERELGRLLEFMGVAATPAEIGEAVAFASFDRMKEKERDGFFKSRRLGPTDAQDPESYKVREGVVGGYRRHVEPAQAARLDALVQTRLAPVYGYADEPA